MADLVRTCYSKKNKYNDEVDYSMVVFHDAYLSETG